MKAIAQHWHLTVAQYWHMRLLSAITLGPLLAVMYLVLFSKRRRL